jgi:hypothetical protein
MDSEAEWALARKDLSAASLKLSRLIEMSTADLSAFQKAVHKQRIREAKAHLKMADKACLELRRTGDWHATRRYVPAA